MMTTARFVRYLSAVAVLSVALMSTAQASDKVTNTILGAGLGAAAGAVLSEGDPMLTIGGAAAGGVLGNILTEDKRDRRSYHSKHHSRPKHHYVNHSNKKGWHAKHARKHNKKRHRHHHRR